MDTLRSLLIQNQTNLDRLRARARYLFHHLSAAEVDTHKLYGPYSAAWDEWSEETRDILAEVKVDILATQEFVDELREFVESSPHSKKPTKSKKKQQYIVEMKTFAEEARLCQLEMINLADARLSEHQELTNKLRLVEALDRLSEE